MTMTTTKPATKVHPEKRYNAQCKGCKKKHTALLTRIDNVATGYAWRSSLGAILTTTKDGYKPSLPCDCGRIVQFLLVQGTYVAEKKCNAKCLAACGQVCECSCGGRNHGASCSAH
jgi:hypothetical protein